MLALVLSNFMANALALFSKVTSFLNLLYNIIGYILMPLLLMQAKLKEVKFDLRPIPAMYDGISFLLYMVRWQL